MKKNSGITLIALVITIIVMLILVMVTINIATNGGLFSYAGKASVDTEMAKEMEIVKVSATEAWLDSNIDNILAEEKNAILQANMQRAVEGNAKGRNVEVLTDTEGLVVHFIDVGRKYWVDSNGDVYEIIEDDTPGELDGTGTQNDPFKIKSIEDLVVLSIMVNGGDEDLGLEENDFAGQYLTLERTLDFNSRYSYCNPDTTIYDTYLNGDGTNTLITQLSTRKWI